ncbi:MAG: hypothetical protein IT314_16480 [Anaerolineales bacterium]|nr:hypothetical protein [Anaerolineales bacterium]
MSTMNELNEINELNVAIEQMVLDITALACQLDDVRLCMFINWLTAHNGNVTTAAGIVAGMDIAALRTAEMQGRFKSALRSWLTYLPKPDLLFQRRILFAEINWWRDLDPIRLKAFVKLEAEPLERKQWAEPILDQPDDPSQREKVPVLDK